MISDVFPGLDPCYTDPVQHLITAGLDLSSVDSLDRDLFDLYLSFERTADIFLRFSFAGYDSLVTGRTTSSFL